MADRAASTTTQETFSYRTWQCFVLQQINGQSPTSNSRKDEIKQWLGKQNIQYSDIKTKLLDLVRQHRLKPLYLTDEAIQEHGHLVLHLPVAHCGLNPIELAWASVKGYVSKHKKDYKEVGRLVVVYC